MPRCFLLSSSPRPCPLCKSFPVLGPPRPWVGGASDVGGAAVMVNTPQTPSADRASHITIPAHLPDGCCHQPWVVMAPSHPPSPHEQLNAMAEEQPVECLLLEFISAPFAEKMLDQEAGALSSSPTSALGIWGLSASLAIGRGCSRDDFRVLRDLRN